MFYFTMVGEEGNANILVVTRLYSEDGSTCDMVEVKIRPDNGKPGMVIQVDREDLIDALKALR